MNPIDNSDSIFLQDLCLPFHFLLSIASIISPACLEQCVTSLEHMMLADEDISNIDAWVNFELQGEPIWHRSQCLIQIIEHEMEHTAPRPIECIINKQDVDIADFAAFTLLQRSRFNWPIKVSVTHFNYLSSIQDKLFLLGYIIKLKPTISTPNLPSILTDQFLKLTGISFNEWHAIIEVEKEAHSKFNFQFCSAIYRYLQLGDGNQALKLIKMIKERNHFTGKDLGIIDATIMKILFHQHHYQELADTNEAWWWKLSPDNIKHMLYYIKAYSATMVSQIKLAGKYFKKLKIDKDIKINNTDDLYTLNIYARYQYISNQKQAALDIEKKIEDQINQTNPTSSSITYINSINIARLYRQNREYSHSLEYYQKAYHSIQNHMHESNHVYKHYNVFSVHLAQQHFTLAIGELLQSIMAWQTMICPEALSFRPAKAILNGKGIAPDHPLFIEKIAIEFQIKLSSLLEKILKKPLHDFNDITSSLLKMDSYQKIFEGIRHNAYLFNKAKNPIQKNIPLSFTNWHKLTKLSCRMAKELTDIAVTH